MGRGQKERVDKLERNTKRDDVEVVVNWDPNAGPVGDDVKVVTWDGLDDQDDDQVGKVGRGANA